MGSINTYNRELIFDILKLIEERGLTVAEADYVPSALKMALEECKSELHCTAKLRVPVSAQDMT